MPTEDSNLCQFLRPPKPIVIEHDKDMAREWKLWKQQYEFFETATGMDTKSQKVQVATFMSAIGYSALQIYNSHPTPTTERTLDEVKNLFQKYFTPKINTTFERYKFNKIAQKDGETIDELMSRLRLQAQNCAFEGLTDSLLRDQLILGIQSDDLRTKLLSQDIDLAKAIQLCQATEMAQKQSAQIVNEGDKTVNFVKKFPNHKTKRFDCRNCGKNHEIRRCTAYNHVCKKCNQRNHFEKFCKKKLWKNSHKSNDSPSKQIHCCEEPEDDDDDSLFIGTIAENTNLECDNFTEKLYMEGNSYKIKLDTGAQCNVLPKWVIEKTNANINPSKVKHLVSFSNHRMKVLGETLIPCTIAGRQCKIAFKVVAENIKPILEANACENLDLLPE